MCGVFMEIQIEQRHLQKISNIWKLVIQIKIYRLSRIQGIYTL